MKKILIVSPNWLGDALFSTALLAVLKANFIHSHLAVLSVPRVKEIFENNPNVDEIIIYDEKGRHRNPVSRLGFILQLRKQAFDTAFVLRPSLSRTLILKFAGIKQIIGHNNSKSGMWLTKRVPLPQGKLHKIDYFLTLIEHLGLNIDQRRYEFFPSEDDKNYVSGLLEQNNIMLLQPLVVINPGANWHPKRWGPDCFAELIKRVKENKPRINIILTGADKDKALAEDIIRNSGKDVLSLAGKTSLGQLGALMQKADIVISADSGPMHIAAAVGKQVVALFGPTSAQITGPYPTSKHIIIQKDIGCDVPCYDSNCRDYRCMREISVEEVIKKVFAIV